MTDKIEAATDGSGLGRCADDMMLIGLDKKVTRKQEKLTDREAQQLVQRMAAMTVRRYANRHACAQALVNACNHLDHQRDSLDLLDLLEMLDLPEEYDPPTEEDREALLESLPRTSSFDRQKPGDTIIRKK
jgi:hypothetical protein